MNVVISDRYSALGVPRPDPATMCKGQCEGLGFHPTDIHSGFREYTAEEIAAWNAEHEKEPHQCNGWHFITCVTCKGTGKQNGDTE